STTSSTSTRSSSPRSSATRTPWPPRRISRRRSPPPDRPEVVTGTAEERLQHALDLAYRYLGRRDRTVLEVRRHLEGKRVEPSAIDGALASLAEAGYLDDARYARRFAEDRRELDDWGADRIARRLHAAGVGEAEVAAALDAQDGHSEHDAAIALLRRKLRVP